MPAPDSAAAVDASWPELDRCFLQKDRRAPPPFPLDVIAAPWRPWIEGHAQAALCADYIAQGLLAAVSAVCGSRFVVDVTPHWREPLVLWQLLVGAPSTGKTPAMAAARRLLAGVTAPPDEGPVEDSPSRRDEPELTAWLLHRGISRWNDGSDWLAEVSRDGGDRATVLGGWTGDPAHREDLLDVGRSSSRWAESIFGTLQADRLPQTLTEIDDGLLSRFLYCWPVPRLEARLDRIEAGEGVRLLQRLVDLPGTCCEPAALGLQEAAAGRLQDLLPRLRAFMRDTDGLEAAWIGKGAGTIVRLAGLLSLMDWAAAGGETPCTTVEEQHVERAHALWNDYFWPHAQSVFGQSALTIDQRRVRRVGQWLKRMRPQIVSREEVRREALTHSVDAETAERVIERLEEHGVLRMLESQTGPAGGRPRRRWQVNPELWAG
ncbi:MAG: DUF3987 domain-containing protein [Reyranellales bacterium]